MSANAIWILIVLAALALCGIVVWSGAARQSPASEAGDVTIAAGAVDGDLITAGRNVEVRSQIDGDLAVAGDRIVVAGPVAGYALVAGSEVVVGGAVEDDIWAAGSRVTLASRVGDSVRAAGHTVIVQPQARIERNALLAGNRVEVRGPIGNDLQVAAAEVVIASEVAGSVRARTGNLELLPGAVIRGDLIVASRAEPRIASGAQVLGRVRHEERAADDEDWQVTSWLLQWLFSFLALMALGVVTIATAARGSARIVDEIRRRPGLSLFVGIIALIVVPLIAALLAATLIGIPLALVAFALYGAALLLSGVFVALRIGGWAMQRARRAESSPYSRLAAGAFVLSFIAALPWIGWLVWILAPAIGLGALLLDRNSAWRAESAASAA